MTNETTLVALATYNERENLPLLVDEILTTLPKVDIVVVDDNSPDGTGQWCDERAASEPRLSVIHRPGKLGLGTAAVAAMRYAIEHDYEWLITMDADFSHPPRHLSDLLESIEHADVAIGSRYCPGGGIEGWPLRRRIMSRTVNSAARWMLGLPVGDCSGAYRCYRVAMLRRIDFEEMQATGYAYLEELLFLLHRAGARFAETPITFVDRVRGQSKINLGEGVAAAKTFMRLAWQRVRRS